jgi:methionyl-tRNA formyltransferase
MNTPYTYAFFGTGALAESVLASLVSSGHPPTLIVTKPDSPQGRHMQLTAPHIKTWAQMKGIETYQPESLKEIPDDSPLHTKKFDLFIVASYGKIIPENILNIPLHGVLNVHPSLLPKYRGPSPIQSFLLSGEMTTGVTIMKLDAQMDHGPILAQSKVLISPYANTGTLEVTLGQEGGKLLVSLISHYLEGVLIPKEQEHGEATLCKKITKELGSIHLEDNIEEVRRKFRALTPWPTLYFFIEHKGVMMRVKINELDLTSSKEGCTQAQDYLISVTPEGKKQMDWESFKRGYL